MTERLTDSERQVLERVAQGVWVQHGGHDEAPVWHQCAFCYVAPQSEHDEDCPVRLAREAGY